MQESMLFKLGFDPVYLIAAMLISILVLFVLLINVFMKYARLKNKYYVFMKGKDGKTLEVVMSERFKALEWLIESNQQIKETIKEIKKDANDAYQKVGIVKYDAFHEMGGKLSFALTLLNDKDSGFIINAMHSREGCYTYTKEIVKGESYIELSEEELESLQRAKYQSAYGMDLDIKGELKE